MLFDVDGVLTDGRLYLSDSGQEYKSFHSRDGHGMKMLQASGVQIGIITGRRSRLVALRCSELGINHVYQGYRDKLPALQALLADTGLAPEAIGYAGDDVVDLPVMRRVGLAVAVADAHPLVLEAAHWRTRNGGGRGAAREICDLLMQAQGTLDEQLAPYTG